MIHLLGIMAISANTLPRECRSWEIHKLIDNGQCLSIVVDYAAEEEAHLHLIESIYYVKACFDWVIFRTKRLLQSNQRYKNNKEALLIKLRQNPFEYLRQTPKLNKIHNW